MTAFPPPDPAFARLALFNWLLARLKDATGFSDAILHSADGSDLSVAALAAEIDRIAVHLIEANSADPARAFFSRFAETLSRPRRAAPDLPFPLSVADILETPALHLFADPDLASGPPPPGVTLFVPFLSGAETPVPLAGGRAIRIGGQFAGSISGLAADAWSRFEEKTGARANGGDIQLETPDLPALPVFSIPAERLLHDGGFFAESAGDYGWLWTGPDAHFRVMIGAIPFRPARISLTVAGEAAAGNLENAKIFVNGGPKPSRAECWGGGGGRLSVELDESAANPVVLSVCAPAMVDIEGRKLGLSIAHLDIGETM
jgi:hypothetical protein